MQLLLLILAILYAASGAGLDRKLYFLEPSKPGQHVPVGNTILTFEAGHRINLRLEARTRSLEDRNDFVHLIIDDYRYDEPNYFTDKRVPNVTFEVTMLENGRYKRVPFRVSSQGSGASVEYLSAHVAFEIGGAPEKIETETRKISQEVLARTLRLEDAAARLEVIKRQWAPNQPGRYRIRAFYRPNVPGKWKGALATLPVRILISDQKQEAH